MSEQSAPNAARRRLTGRLNLWVASLLLAAIVAMVNYLAFRHYERWDWTSQNLYTLSDRTEEVLAELSRPIDAYVFMSSRERNFRDVKELLQRYRAENNRINVHYVDPDQRPSQYKTLLQRFGVRAAMHPSGQQTGDVAMVVTTGERHWRIKREEMFELDMGSMNKGQSGPKVDIKAERAITGAIVQVIHGEPTQVCVTTGHGEWSLEGGRDVSLQPLQQELRRDNVQLETIETLGQSAIPDRCHAVFVIGPTQAFGKQEAKLLEGYVRSGGSVLLALDPVFDQQRIQPTGLEGMSERLGVRLQPSVVLERNPQLQLAGSPAEPYLVRRYGKHAITEKLRMERIPTVIHFARGVEPVKGGGAKKLLQTSDQGYGETDLAELGPETPLEPEDADYEGPIALGAAVEIETGDGGDADPGRLVVMGSSSWLQGSFMESRRFANDILASSTTGWLADRQALISIPPREVDAAAITMTRGDLRGLAFRVLLLMPAAVVLLGIAVWWSRRS